MKFALIDLRESPQGCNNKDKAGTFGNAMRGEGLIARAYQLLKWNNVDMPVVHFGYIAAILRQKGHSVTFYDSFPRDEEVVIIASSIVGYDEEIEFARRLKREGRKVGFISAFASVKPELFLAVADFVIKGEPERAVTEIAKGNVRLEGVIDSPLIEDLETLPFPDWDGFPVTKYGYFPVLKKRPLLSILTSRGCSFDCIYCPYLVMQTEKFRARGAKHAADEIEYLVKKYGIRSLVFRDIMYTQNKKRAAEISEEILGRGLKVEWSCETRADCLDENLIALMARSGLRAVHLGIESPQDEIVKDSGRIPIRETQQEKMVRCCERHGVKVLSFYILGFRDDTEDSMRRTIDYAKHLNTFLAQFDIMTPYPGTRFFEEIKSAITTFDWKKYTTHDAVVEFRHVSAGQVLAAKNRAYREYYFRPAWVLKNGSSVLF